MNILLQKNDTICAQLMEGLKLESACNNSVTQGD